MDKAPWSNLGLHLWLWVRIQLRPNFFLLQFFSFIFYFWLRKATGYGFHAFLICILLLLLLIQCKISFYWISGLLFLCLLAGDMCFNVIIGHFWITFDVTFPVLLRFPTGRDRSVSIRFWEKKGFWFGGWFSGSAVVNGRIVVSSEPVISIAILVGVC